MGLYKFRVFNPANMAKAERIADSRSEAEAAIPHGERRVVKRYQGHKKLATYMVDRDIRGGVRWSQMPNN